MKNVKDFVQKTTVEVWIAEICHINPDTEQVKYYDPIERDFFPSKEKAKLHLEGLTECVFPAYADQIYLRGYRVARVRKIEIPLHMFEEMVNGR